TSRSRALYKEVCSALRYRRVSYLTVKSCTARGTPRAASPEGMPAPPPRIRGARRHRRDLGGTGRSPAPPLPRHPLFRPVPPGRREEAMRSFGVDGAAVLASLLAVVLTAPSAHAGSATDVEYETITGHGGIDIHALVISPTGYEGPRPLLVMPSASA